MSINAPFLEEEARTGTDFSRMNNNFILRQNTSQWFIITYLSRIFFFRFGSNSARMKHMPTTKSLNFHNMPALYKGFQVAELKTNMCKHPAVNHMFSCILWYLGIQQFIHTDIVGNLDTQSPGQKPILPNKHSFFVCVCVISVKYWHLERVPAFILSHMKKKSAWIFPYV